MVKCNMKKFRILAAVLLVCLTAGAWTAWAGRYSSRETSFQALWDKAKGYAEEELYQKAAETYENALALKDDPSLRAEQLQAYENGYHAGVISKKTYINALTQASSQAPKNAVYWEKIISVHMENNEYSDAYKACKNAARAGAKSEALDSLLNTVTYSYKIKSKVYRTAFLSTAGYYTVFDGTHWGVLSPAGDSWVYDCVYRYISPVGADGSVYIETVGDSENTDSEADEEKRTAYLADKTDRIQAYVNFGSKLCRAASERYVPVSANGTWSYFDCENGAFLPEIYEDASAVSGTTAAVKENGRWHLKDLSDNTSIGTDFDDIRLFENGEYLYDEKMLAAENGVYALYNIIGKKLAEQPGKTTDVYRGGLIAFQAESGLWGYADTKGKTIIEPQFEGAKSFSGGLGAVCIDGKWGFLSEKGQIVIECTYLDVGYFNQNGVCFVSLTEGEYFPIVLRFPQK